MVSELITYEGLFAVQLVGTIVLVVGLFQGGLTLLTVAGGLIILLAIIGHVLAAVRFEPDDEVVEERGRGDREREREQDPAGSGVGR